MPNSTAMDEVSVLTASDPDKKGGRRVRVSSVRQFVAMACMCGFWIGVGMALSGLFICFSPGLACRWFLVAGILIGTGVFVPEQSYRFAAIAVCILCLGASYAGYQRGIEYQEWLREFESTILPQLKRDIVTEERKRK